VLDCTLDDVYLPTAMMIRLSLTAAVESSLCATMWQLIVQSSLDYRLV